MASRQAGVISESDALEILELSALMHEELYSSYEEFMEEESVLLKRLETHGKEWVAAREENERMKEEVEQTKRKAKREVERAKREAEQTKRSERELKERVRELEKQLEEARKQ